MSRSFRSQAKSLGNVVKEQRPLSPIWWWMRQKPRAGWEGEGRPGGQAEKELIKPAQKAEGEAAKKAHDEAHAPYEGLTDDEFSDELAEKDLPKSGNVDELIERLVGADSQ